MRLLKPLPLQALPAAWRYGLTVAIVAAVTALRWALIPWLGTTAPYNLAIVATVVTTVLFGIGPGVLSVVLADVAVELFVTGSLRTGLEGTALLRLVTAMAIGLFVALLLHVIRIAQLHAHQSEARYRTLLELCPDAILVHAEGKYVFANPAAARLFGAASPQELIGQDVLELVHPSDRSIVAQRIEQIYGGEVTPLREVQWLRLDGSPVAVEVTGARVEFNGEPAIQAVARDITVRKQAEEALRESEERLAFALETGRTGTWDLDLVNQTAHRSLLHDQIFGYRTPLPVWTYEMFLEHVLPEDREEVDHRYRQALQSGGDWSFECRIRRSDGELRWIWAAGRHHRDAAGHASRMAGIVQDITERKQAEEEIARLNQDLQRRVAELQTIFETTPIGLSIAADSQGLHIRGNPANERMFGIGRGGELSKVGPQAGQFRCFQEERELAVTELPMQRAIRGQTVTGQIMDVVRADGQTLTLYCSASPLLDEQGSPRGAVGAFLDITSLKRAEEAARRAHEQLGMALHGAGAGSWDWDLPTGKLVWSPELFDLFGLDPATSDASFDTWERILHPDDLATANAQIDRALKERTSLSSEYRIVQGDGQIRWISALGHGIYDSQGQPLRMLGLCIDITERKQAEAALAAAKAAAEAANAAKSQFLANMSHELRTPMNAILGMIDIALPKATDPTVRDCLQTAKGSADLLLTLLNDLLDSAKVESGRLELESAPFSLRQMLDRLTRVLAAHAGEKGLTFSCRIAEDTPDALRGDRVRLQQVLLNLASNAIKFTERGSVEIRVQARVHDGEAELEFAVRDTGIGIPASSQERLFQPFAQADASMSRRFGSTGLGLSISKSLVELMGGRIGVESVPGQGSTFSFTVRLPLAVDLPAELEAPRTLLAAACGPLRVLLVEDNPANQKLTAYLLQDRGHQVEIAGDGPAALRLTEQNRYDVILMDVQMPGMSGLEATAAIRQREKQGPRTPILAMTAHAMPGDRERCLAAGMDGYLAKPVHASELLELVERLAGNAAASPDLAEAPPRPTALGFHPDEALARCCHSRDLLREMIQSFFDEAEILFPRMRAALARGDLVEIGRLGHRLKGTVVYLAAPAAEEAALAVERFGYRHGGSAAEAAAALETLERVCLLLKATLIESPLAAAAMPEE